MENRGFLRLLWATLIMIFLVILAGSVVRMTGSGMGCPDWPKCFGYIIPPTEASQVQFQPNFEYHQGQMIVVEDQLLRATTDFTSSLTFNESNWEVYETHDYAFFNPTHTWIEYINRLLGALSGLFMLAVLFVTFFLVAKNKLKWPMILLSIFGVLLLGFQAWLGKVVVDSNLAGAKITAHLFGALALVALVLVMIRITIGNRFLVLNKKLTPWIWGSFIILMIQIFLGTEVRHLVDDLASDAISNVFSSISFKVHRSFSWAILLSTACLCYFAMKVQELKPPFILLAILIISEGLVGLCLYFLQLPKLAQPVHLLLANLLFAGFVWLLLARKNG